MKKHYLLKLLLLLVLMGAVWSCRESFELDEFKDVLIINQPPYLDGLEIAHIAADDGVELVAGPLGDTGFVQLDRHAGWHLLLERLDLRLHRLGDVFLVGLAEFLQRNLHLIAVLFFQRDQVVVQQVAEPVVLGHGVVTQGDRQGPHQAAIKVTAILLLRVLINSSSADSEIF